MKKSPQVLFIIVLSILYSCSTLNKTEIKSLTKTSFDDLIISPAYEIYDLRIDLIRQTTTEQTSENSAETVNVEYNPLGFDLGNGIFYDINNNISLRMDHFFPVKSGNNIILERYRNVKKEEPSKKYIIKDSTFCTAEKAIFSYKKCINVESYNDSICLKNKNRFLYSIVKKDSTLFCKTKRKAKYAIFKKSNNCYYIKTWLKKKEYKLNNNEISFEKEYVIKMNKDKSIIEIYKRYIRNEALEYYIIKSKNAIYIYDKKFRGKKIEYDDNELIVYDNKKFDYKIVMK